MSEGSDLDGVPFTWVSEESKKTINLSEDVLENQYPQSYKDNTREAFKYEDKKTGKTRGFKPYVISTEVMEFLKGWVERLTVKIDDGTITLEELDIYMEVLRALRNAASSENSKLWVMNNMDLNSIIPKLFDHLVSLDANHFGIRIICQFLHNVITLNEAGVHKFEAMMKKLSLRCYDMQVYEFEASALMYQMFLQVRYYDLDLFTIMLDIFLVRENEFLHFLFNSCLRLKHFWKRLYPYLKIEHRLYFLQMVRHYQFAAGRLQSDITCVKLSLKTFLKSGDIIFQTTDSADKVKEAQEVAYMLEILAAASSEIKYSHFFYNNSDLLIHCGALLINLHRLGKESNNCFTPVSKLSDYKNADLVEHPAFCFKADLIRLIANLTYKRFPIQELARTAELIPVILDCCNIDANNPFIMQWCIITIRNLCDNNVENQKLIAALHREGVVTNELLTDMNLELNAEGDKITLIPVEGYSKLF